MANLLRLISQRRDEFEQEPIGPLGLYLGLKDGRYRSRSSDSSGTWNVPDNIAFAQPLWMCLGQVGH